LFNETVYNIEVGKNHTYIANNIRVHNKLSSTFDRQRIRNARKEIIEILDEAERQRKEYEDWLGENYPGVLEDGWPYLGEGYEPVTSTGGSGGTTPGGTPPDGGVPRGVGSGGQDPGPTGTGQGGTGQGGTFVSPYGSDVFEDSGRSGRDGQVPTVLQKGTTISQNVYGTRRGTCFPGNSKVFTPNGKVNIDSINIGEYIYTYDMNGNKKASNVVMKTFHTMDEFNTVFMYKLDNGLVLNATSNHSVLTNINGKIEFERLDRLSIGSILYNEYLSESKIIDILEIGNFDVYHVVPEDGRIICIDGILVDTMELFYA
jgi:hypothetical protein